MILISNGELAESLNDTVDARRISTSQRWRWAGRHAQGILPGLFLSSIVAAAALAARQLPGMATFSPMILSIVIGIAFHNIVGLRPGRNRA